MPRWLLRRTEAQRWYRRSKKTGYAVNRAAVAFVDYFRIQGGTLPEMMVYSELIRRRIPFAYQKYLGDIPFTDETERYRPDFTLDDYRIIIRVQGVYWHTRPGDAEADARQAQLMTMLGWHVYDLWENDILRDVRKSVDTIPELVNPSILGPPEEALGRPFNALAGFLARIRKPPKVLHKKYAKKRGAKGKVVRGWFPRRRHAPFTIDYVPVRFIGWKEQPDRWPGADDWWEERKKKRQSPATPASALHAETESWEALNKSSASGFEQVAREFDQFPATEPDGDVADKTKDPEDFWGSVQERILEMAGR